MMKHTSDIGWGLNAGAIDLWPAALYQLGHEGALK